MAVFAQDTYVGTNWITINAAGADLGGPIVNHPDDSGWCYIYANKALWRTGGLVYYSGTPASADYSVTALITVKSSVGSTGVAGRINTTEKTYYAAYIEQTTNKVVLIKYVNGVVTRLSSVSASSYGIGDHLLTLTMAGTTISAVIGGTLSGSTLTGGTVVVTDTDSSITAPGKAGHRATFVSDTTTGKHLDNFVATDGSAAASPRSYVVGMIGL